MRVHIQNFQSLKDVQFEVSGFTVLVGRSNLGKSATIRAIEGALFNAPADAYIRDGASSLMVHLQSPDFDIRWRKGGGHNDYEVDGVTFESVGRDVPAVIRDKGFRDLEVNKNHLRVQVSDQFHPLFLLDCSGTDAAQAISDVHRIYEIQAAQEAVDKDRRSVRAEIKIREKDLIQAKERALRLDSLEESVKHLKEIHVRGQALTHARARVTRLRTDAHAYTRAYAGAQASGRVEGLNVPVMPQTRFREAMRDAQHAKRLQRRIDAHRDFPLPTLPQQPHPAMRRDLEVARFLTARIEALEAIASIQPPAIPDRTRLRAMLQDATSVRSLVSKMQTLRDEILTCNNEIATLEAQIRDIEINSPTCPLCGQATQTHQHA